MLNKMLIAGSAMALGLATSPAEAQNGWDDGEWISVSGAVNSVDDDSFTLDYGQGVIEVETDDLFSEMEPEQNLREGERVTVYGEVDEDWWEGEVIEASHVFARDRSSFYGGQAPVVSSVYFLDPYGDTGAEGTWLALEGEVREIAGRELTLASGGETISVDTMEMSSNPLDSLGTQQIEKGDRIVVAGAIDTSLFDERELSAEYMYSIENNGQQDRSASKNADDRRQKSQARYSDNRSPKNSGDNLADKQSNQRDRSNEKRESDQAESAADVTEYAKSGSEFAMIDSDNNGYLSEREYVNFISQPRNISKQEARRLFKAAARNDERISRQEFVSSNDEVRRIFANVVENDM